MPVYPQVVNMPRETHIQRGGRRERQTDRQTDGQT